MILTALKELAEREGLVNDRDYEPKPIHYLVHVNRDGRITGFTSTLSPPPNGKGKPQPKKMQVPRQSGRTSGAVAEFLCDKAEYVFGTDPNGTRSSSELANRRALFRAKLQAGATATNDEALCCLLKALVEFGNGSSPPLPADVAPNSLFAFVFAPDGDKLISDRATVRDYWRAQRAEATADSDPHDVGMCLVTGERCLPTDKHPSLKRIPGANPAGAALVSFNAPAFQSYGLERNDNAFVSRPAAEAYTTALNRLLDPAYPNPADGTPLPRRNVRLNDTTVAVYWSREASGFVDMFADVIEANPAAIHALFDAPQVGRNVVVDDPQAFYAAILSGAQGRVILRDWIETTVGSVARNVAQHFDDLAVVRSRGQTDPLPLWRLLRSTAALRKQENIAPTLATDCFGAILRGGLYPRALLDASARRMRAEQNVPAERAALIKAYLLRARRLGRLPPTFPEVTMSLATARRRAA